MGRLGQCDSQGFRIWNGHFKSSHNKFMPLAGFILIFKNNSTSVVLIVCILLYNLYEHHW